MAAQATVSLEKAKCREPAKASIREALGIAYFRLRRYQEAESEFRALPDLSPADELRALRARPRPREARRTARPRPPEARQLVAPGQRALRRARLRALE